METTQEDVDPRSLKRQTTAAMRQPCDSAARAVALLDVAVWTSIIEFVTMPKEIDMVEKGGVKLDYEEQAEHYDAAVAEVVATWRTLLNLRLVSKELARLLHPTDSKALWKKLLLQGFDFSMAWGFNLENHQEEHDLDIPADEVDEEEQGEANDHRDQPHNQTTAPSQELADDETERNPQLVAMHGRYYNMPPDHLEERLGDWYNLGISHRPSQYGFLTTLQQQPPVGEWPESEDPFTLFGDLVRLLMLPRGECMIAGGEGGDWTFKYLAAPTERPSSSAYFRFYVMKTLGYVPQFWHWGRGIGGAWKGFADPKAFDALVKSQFPDKEEEDEDEDRDEEDIEGFEDLGLPDCSIRLAKLLYQHVRQHCQDWRSVCCNKGWDGYTPVFFMGESKALPHRWIGYAGGKCWT